MAAILDKRDRVILYELDKNARQPLSKIAKKVRLKRESILYRIKNYLKKGLIRDYLTVVNMAKLGFVHYKVYMKLQNITETEEHNFIKALCKNPYVTWVASCDGSYSLIFAIKARTINELDYLLRDINNSYWKFIKEQHITTISNARHYYREYLLDDKNLSEREIIWGGNPEKTDLDKTNIIILDQLCGDSRINSVNISSKIGISPESIIKRIKKLERSQIITHYMIWSNVNLLKGIYYKVLVKFHNVKENDERELVNYCSKNSNIIYTVNCVGDWQFEMDIEVGDILEFRKIIREFTNKFYKIISDYTALNIYEEYKFRFFEKEIMQENAKKDLKI